MKKILLPVLTIIYLLVPASPSRARDPDFRSLRLKMVAEQIIDRGISNPLVIEALRKVPRHLFVPPGRQPYAYIDSALPIGSDQTISQPYIVAYMTEALDLRGTERILEIGTGSGYQAAVLAEIAKEVYTIEIIEKLGKKAARLLQSMGYDNIRVRIGDGYRGWPENAPFDAIIVTCAPGKIPSPLIEQLANGGRMIIPVGEEGEIQHLVLARKINGKLAKKDVMKVRFVPMTGEAR